MNKVSLVGRLTHDPELRYTQGSNSNVNASFSVAVNRRFKNSDGNYDADFIRCVAFGKTAEFIGNYFNRGSAIGITGHIQTGSYTNKDGQKIYTTDVVVEDAEFVESRNTASQNGSNAPNTHSANASIDSEMFYTDNTEDEELPFN